MQNRESEKEVRVEREFYPDFRVKTERTWINGRVCGPFRRFFNDGTWYEVNLIDGLEAGTKIYHSSDGKIYWEIWYHQGIKNGMERRYYEDGNIENETTWENGVKSGKQKFYDKDGKLIQENLWSNGELSEMIVHRDDFNAKLTFSLNSELSEVMYI